MNELRINQHFVCILNEFWQVSPLERESWWFTRCERRTKQFHSVTQHHRHRRRHKIYKFLQIESHTKPYASWNGTWTASAAKTQKIKLLSKYQQRWIDRAEAIVAHAELLPRASNILRVKCERIKCIYIRTCRASWFRERSPGCIAFTVCTALDGCKIYGELKLRKFIQVTLSGFIFHYRFVSGVRRSAFEHKWVNSTF